MTTKQRLVIWSSILVLFLIVLAGMRYRPKHAALPIGVPAVIVQAPTADMRESKVQAAMWDIAKVFGRNAGCKDADPALGRLVAEAALAENVDPKIVASVIGVESKCSPFATSSRGAIGLMQVRPEIWKDSFDFQGKVNLLNERDNVRTGTHILAGYIKTYGTQDGVLHYQGTGTGANCTTCDPTYVDKVLTLAGK